MSAFGEVVSPTYQATFAKTGSGSQILLRQFKHFLMTAVILEVAFFADFGFREVSSTLKFSIGSTYLFLFFLVRTLSPRAVVL